MCQQGVVVLLNNVIVVAGETGAGKDFLVERANRYEGIAHINWGDLFGTHARLDKDKDKLAYLPGAPHTEAIQRVICQQVLALKPVIVTSHPIKEIGGIEYVNWAAEELLCPEEYVLITAPSKVIAERVRKRNEEGLRQCTEFSVEEIARRQINKLERIAELATYIGAGLTVLYNTEAKTDVNTRILAGLIHSCKIEAHYANTVDNT